MESAFVSVHRAAVSQEFHRADVARRNPLVWIIEVNGVAMDARHVPMDIQMEEACRRGLIPYVPAFGPDGKAPREESPVTRTASAAAPAVVGLLERSRELKRQLVASPVRRVSPGSSIWPLATASAARSLMMANSPTLLTTSSCSARWPTAA